MRRSMWIVVVVAACSAPQRPAPYPAPAVVPAAVVAPATVASPAPTSPPDTADVERTVAAGTIAYVFRVSQMANLVFQLDCLAGLTSCSRAAFAADWHATAWTADDDAAIAAWQQLHHYRGEIDDGSARADAPLPLPHHLRSVADSVRIAGYGARDAEDYLTRLALFASSADVAQARQILARFAPRAADGWRATRAGLIAAQDDYAALVEQPDVRALLARVAALYHFEPAATRLTFALIARPRHASSSNAQQLGEYSVVEVITGESPRRKFPVVMHELFHAWLSAAPIEAQVALVARFAATPDPLAAPAYGLLDEVLATALGNGLVARTVAPDEYDLRIRMPLGLYADRSIDATAKALLPALEARLAAGGSVFDDDFVPAYLRAVHAAFPEGLAPIAYLRPMACAFDQAFADAYHHLLEVSRTSTAECTSGPREAVDVFRRHAASGQAILWPRAKLAALAPLVDAPTMATLRRQAKPGRPFVLTTRRARAGVRFILVADDAAAARALVDAFAAQTQLRDGVVAL